MEMKKGKDMSFELVLEQVVVLRHYRCLFLSFSSCLFMSLLVSISAHILSIIQFVIRGQTDGMSYESGWTIQ